jgi:hypothetical protein
VCCSLDVAIWHGFFELDHIGLVSGVFEHEVHPVE